MSKRSARDQSTDTNDDKKKGVIKSSLPTTILLTPWRRLFSLKALIMVFYMVLISDGIAAIWIIAFKLDLLGDDDLLDNFTTMWLLISLILSVLISNFLVAIAKRFPKKSLLFQNTVLGIISLIENHRQIINLKDFGKEVKALREEEADAITNTMEAMILNTAGMFVRNARIRRGGRQTQTRDCKTVTVTFKDGSWSTFTILKREDKGDSLTSVDKVTKNLISLRTMIALSYPPELIHSALNFISSVEVSVRLHSQSLLVASFSIIECFSIILLLFMAALLPGLLWSFFGYYLFLVYPFLFLTCTTILCCTAWLGDPFEGNFENDAYDYQQSIFYAFHMLDGCKKDADVKDL